jgi:hypothetical protein
MAFFTPNNEVLDADFSKDKRDVQEQGGVKAFYLQPGVTNVRILPPFSEKGVWYREIREYNLVVDGQRRVFTAPADGDVDPIEEKRQALLSAGGDFNIKAAEGIKANRRYLLNALVWVAPPNTEFARGVVVALKVPVTVKRHLLEMDRDVQGGWANITDPNNGVNIKISRTGKGLNTEYSVSPMPNRSNLTNDLAAVGVDVNALQLFNLDELYPALPTEELRRVASKVGNVVVPGQATPVVIAQPVQQVAAQLQTPVPAPVVFVPGMDIPPPPPSQ